VGRGLSGRCGALPQDFGNEDGEKTRKRQSKQGRGNLGRQDKQFRELKGGLKGG